MGITLNRADGCRTLLFSGNRDDAYVTPRTYSLRTDGDILSGGKTYKLHLPGGIPAKLFWSVTVYDGEHASGLDNGQPLPSINARDNPKANDDGSVDIYVGPEEPKGAANWLRTVPGRSWFTIIRLYGPDKPYFDNTWKPDDIVKVN